MHESAAGAIERPALKKVAELHPTLNLGNFIEATRTVPDTAIALIDLTERDPKTLTYGDLEREIRLCVGAFRALGVKRGARFALALPNCRLFLIGFLALMRIGAIPVFINSHLSNDALRHIVTDSGSEGLLGLAALANVHWKERQIVERAQGRLLVVRGQNAGDALTVVVSGGIGETRHRIFLLRARNVTRSADLPFARSDTIGT